MSTRPIQIGDIVRVIIQGKNYDIPIERIDSEGIHGSSYTFIPQNDVWQVRNYSLPHTVSFHPKTKASSLDLEPTIQTFDTFAGPRKFLVLRGSNETVYNMMS